ncbi:MAG TPA: penicillin-binding transpeptidase domain-containing protein, partial [Acidobacteriota bacterium]|nr:penicillin-binding transpeptidase domain-containing protein [Acidobacteriota bacterium]
LSNNKTLYDWKTHGSVPDINTATAVSCNIAFAKIALELKPSDLMANLKQFGFNSQLSDAFEPLPLGKILDGDGSDDYLAHLSIGLNYVQMTPLHEALLAASVANHGVAMTPTLLLERRNIIGTPYNVRTPVELGRFMSEQTASTISMAMQQVVLNADGTGRRAAIDNFPFAMKTGTAGEGTNGYNAVVIGFAPVPDPKIAFAIFLEHAGKAEFEGARVTKLFLQSVQGYIK